MIFNLAYGKTGHSVELSDDYNIDFIEPRWIEGVCDQTLAITDSLRNPNGSKPLKDIVQTTDKVAIIFSDITRATPYDIIIPALLSELKNIHKGNICFFCANGTHRLATREELVKILGNNIVKDFRIVQNDANNFDLHQYMGTTHSGNKVFLNKELQKFDHKILTGFIEPHFFAGFSGGGKALMPGMAFVDTIKFNHSIAHLSLDKVTWGITYGNPLWEEIMEAAEFSSGLFLLNVTLNKDKKITNVFAGDLRAAHQAGCKFARDSAMVPVDKLYDIVITSNSGYPLDLNIYQTVKGMSAAAQVVKQGGNIIVASECWDGLPPNSDYETILSSVKNVDELMEFIKRKENILKDTWQIYFQALIQQKANVFIFSKKIDNETIKRAFLSPV
ncbi:MAG: nickel-dependent lactate racemase, partial [Bacteroidales bacterium]